MNSNEIGEAVKKSAQRYEKIHDCAKEIRTTLRSSPDVDVTKLKVELDQLYSDVALYDKIILESLSSIGFEPSDSLITALEFRSDKIQSVIAITEEISALAKDRSVMISRDLNDNSKTSKAMSGYASACKTGGKIINSKS